MSNYFYVEPIDVTVNLINTKPDPFPLKRFIVELGEEVDHTFSYTNWSMNWTFNVFGEYIYAHLPFSPFADGILYCKKITEPVNAWRKLKNNTNIPNIQNSTSNVASHYVNTPVKPNDVFRIRSSIAGSSFEATVVEDTFTEAVYSNFSNVQPFHYSPSEDLFWMPFDGGFTGYHYGKYKGVQYSVIPPEKSPSLATTLDGKLLCPTLSDIEFSIKEVNLSTNTNRDLKCVSLITSEPNAKVSNIIKVNDDLIVGTIAGGRVHKVLLQGNEVIIQPNILGYTSTGQSTMVFDDVGICLPYQVNSTNSFHLLHGDGNSQLVTGLTSAKYFERRIGYLSDGTVHLVYARENRGICSRKIGKYEY